MRNLTILTTENSPLATWHDDYNGKQLFHVRRIYRDRFDMWQPAKAGFTVTADKANDLDWLIAAIKAQPFAIDYVKAKAKRKFNPRVLTDPGAPLTTEA